MDLFLLLNERFIKREKAAHVMGPYIFGFVWVSHLQDRYKYGKKYLLVFSL